MDGAAEMMRMRTSGRQDRSRALLDAGGSVDFFSFFMSSFFIYFLGPTHEQGQQDGSWVLLGGFVNFSLEPIRTDDVLYHIGNTVA